MDKETIMFAKTKGSPGAIQSALSAAIGFSYSSVALAMCVFVMSLAMYVVGRRIV